MDGEQVVGFGTLSRVEELLLCDPPVVTVQISSREALERCLTALRLSSNLEFVLVDTSVFAYEPVLRCLQTKLELPLSQVLLDTRNEDHAPIIPLSSISPLELANDIEDDDGQDLQNILDLPKRVSLDESQTSSLLAGLRQSVSLIQGPPGKSVTLHIHSTSADPLVLPRYRHRQIFHWRTACQSYT